MQLERFHFETRRRGRTLSLVLAGLVLIVAISAPVFVSRSLLQDLFFILTMLTLAMNWNVLAGFAGLVSVGQQLFVGLGGYALFYVAVILNADALWGLALGGVVSVLAGVLAMLFLFRLNGAYFAVGSWVVAEVVRLLSSQWHELGGGTGRSLPNGYTRDLVEVGWIAQVMDIRSSHAFDVFVYLLALGLALATVVGAYVFLRSKGGLGLTAARDNLNASRSVGVNTRTLQMVVYLLTALSTGACGALIYLQKARISPDAAFSVLDWTAYVIFIVVIGGIGTIEGAFIGVLVLFLLQNIFADFGATYLILLGIITIGFMYVAPRGLWGLVEDRLNWRIFPLRRTLVVREKEQ